MATSTPPTGTTPSSTTPGPCAMATPSTPPTGTRTASSVAPQAWSEFRFKGGKGKGKTKGKLFQRLEDTPSEDEYMCAVTLCNELREIYIRNSVHHHPAFAKLNYKYVTSHKEILQNAHLAGQDYATMFHQVLKSYGICKSTVAMDTTNLNMFRNCLRCSLAGNVEVPVPPEVSLPFANYTDPWTVGDPYYTTPSDVLWSPCYKGPASDPTQLQEWQCDMTHLYKRSCRGEPLFCFCDAPHYNFTKAFWICRGCHGDCGWRHQEPPCVHESETHLCLYCFESRQP